MPHFIVCSKRNRVFKVTKFSFHTYFFLKTNEIKFTSIYLKKSKKRSHREISITCNFLQMGNSSSKQVGNHNIQKVSDEVMSVYLLALQVLHKPCQSKTFLWLGNERLIQNFLCTPSQIQRQFERVCRTRVFIYKCIKLDRRSQWIEAEASVT